MEESNNSSSNSSICGSLETVPVLQQQEQDLMDLKEEFGMFADDGMKSSSTSPLEDALLADPDSCGMCGETLVIPRVLSCLHVFCEQCLDRKLMDVGEEGGGGDAGSPDTSITCPTCSQDTKVGTLKLAALPFDITTISTVSLPPTSPISPTSPTSPTISGSPPLTPPLAPSSPSARAIGSPPPPAPPLLCTSCTTREAAVARCSTCHHLLCANCDKAHRYMRLFETHRVHTLEEDIITDLESSSNRRRINISPGDGTGDGPTALTGGKSRVGMCELHGGIEAVWYCVTCAVLCCGPCGSGGVGVELEGGGDGAKPSGVHTGHQLESVQECETRIRHELDQLLADARAQSQHLQAMSAATSDVGSFEELAQQRTVAKDLITETCHSYKAVLERCRDRALDELQALYKDRELKLMDMTEKVGKDISCLDDACRFTSKLLDNGTISDILYLRRIVTARLQHLVRNTGRLEQRYSVEFRTDLKQFEHIARKAFGYMVTERDAMDEPPSPMMGDDAMGGLGASMMAGPVLGKLTGNSAILGQHHQPPPTSPPTNLNHNPFAVTNGNSIGTGSNPSPINSLPTTASMQSSFDGSADLQGPVTGGGGGSGFIQQNQQLALASAHAVAQMKGGRGTSPIVGGGGGSGANGVGMQGFSSIAEYNLAQLASLAENSSASSSIASATSPNPAGAAGHSNSPFIADIFQNDTVFKNLQSLAKLGLGNDHPTMNGHQHSHALTNGHHHHQQHNMLLSANGQHHHRSTSPGSSSATGSTITINTQLFAAAAAAAAASVSAATSPLLSAGTPEVVDMMGGDSVGNGVGGGGAGGNGGGGAGSGGAITRVNKVCPMQIRCKFGQLGATKGQFNSPHGFCLGLEEDIVVADTNNHRIQIFEKTGTFKFQFGMAGKDEGQLWYPRKVAVMRGCGKYVVCDRGNERSRMQIFTKNGHFLKKIAIRYIDIVAGLAVTAHGEIVAVDSVSPTVFVISENGDLLRWFDCSDYMREPSDIAIHGKEFYVCDFKGHNVVVFSEDGAFKRRIGWEAITSYPNGIDISDAGDVLIGDSHGNRFHVAVFSRDGPLISEFECPYVKVSRCCGLKITSEGYVVTLAKNNHHVLVLNTLYIL